MTGARIHWILRRDRRPLQRDAQRDGQADGQIDTAHADAQTDERSADERPGDAAPLLVRCVPPSAGNDTLRPRRLIERSRRPRRAHPQSK